MRRIGPQTILAAAGCSSLSRLRRGPGPRVLDACPAVGAVAELLALLAESAVPATGAVADEVKDARPGSPASGSAAAARPATLGAGRPNPRVDMRRNALAMRRGMCKVGSGFQNCDAPCYLNGATKSQARPPLLSTFAVVR